MAPDHSQNPIGQTVGARIRAARLAKKYTQSQLAAPHFSVSYISAIERGQIHPSLRALEILAQRLELASTQLLSDYSQKFNDKLLSLSTARTNEDEIDLILLAAHLSLLHGTPSAALENLDQLVPDNLQPRKQVHYFYLRGWTLFATGQLHQSEKILSEAAQLSSKQETLYFHERILNLMGMLLSEMHNHVQAIQCHQECLSYLKNAEVSDLFLLSQIYTQLGQHHSHLESFDVALAMFQEALAIAEHLTDDASLQALYWKLSEYYAKAEVYEIAALYAHKCLHLSTQHLSMLKREIYHYLGRVMMMRDQEEARQYLEQALEQENILQDQLLSASTHTYMAEWFFTHQQIAQAEEYSHKAQELALPFGDTLIAAQSLLLLGRIEYAQAQYEKGDRYFVEGLEMLERLRIFAELADQLVLYAQLLEKNGKEHEALMYYRKAFEKGQQTGI